MKKRENEVKKDPFLCTCGPCKRFWRNTFGPEAGRLKRSPVCQSNSVTNNTCTKTNKSPYIPIGHRVVVKDKHPGTVRYIGYLDTETPSRCPKIYVGVKLDDNVNSVHNGIYKGKRYFYCPKGHGAMVNHIQVRPASAPNKKPPMAGNPMFPSYELIRRRRKEREERLLSLDDSAASCSSQDTIRPSLPVLDRNRSATVRATNDPKDIMHLDHQREIEREKQKLRQKSSEEHHLRKRQPPSQLQKWKEEFGGDKRAARMAETLQKLHLAYEEGRKLVGESDHN